MKKNKKNNRYLHFSSMIFYLVNSDTEQYSTIKILAVIVILTSIKKKLEHDKKFFLEGCRRK